ncbi:MAG: HNH endonuclease [Actinomycetia bacterium]|nr:HNH endonuclease [Actinomycetes bacterium]
MYESKQAWLDAARTTVRPYADVRALIGRLEAVSARLLADMIGAYAWPEEIPLPQGPCGYGAQELDGHSFGEDLTSELAVAAGLSETSAFCLADDVAVLTGRLPRCWARVTTGQAPLWQARRIVRECVGVDEGAWPVVDAAVGACLGVLSPGRLFPVVRAAVMAADPGRAERLAALAASRYVHTGADDADPGTGWVSARLDRADVAGLENTIGRVAEALAGHGEPDSADALRAKALGLLGNPAAALQLIRTDTPSADTPSEATTQSLAKTAHVLAPRAQVYVHLWADCVDDPAALARLERIGPALVERVGAITKGCHVRLTPVLNVDGAGIAVDSYEIPQAIRDHVLLREAHDVFPWSARESRHLDLDHTIPWTPGGDGQTSPGNLGPLSRRGHRVKTHAGWELSQPIPGEYYWRTGAGLEVLVDLHGTHRLPMRE